MARTSTSKPILKCRFCGPCATSLAIMGPKFGCGIAACGACTVHIDGQPVRSCSLPVGEVQGAVADHRRAGRATASCIRSSRPGWKNRSPQCGYCQAGQIMSAVALLDEIENPTDDEIDNAMGGNLCRCGTYPAVRAAIHKAAALKTARSMSHGQRRKDCPPHVPDRRRRRRRRCGRRLLVRQETLSQIRWKATSPRARRHSTPT